MRCELLVLHPKPDPNRRPAVRKSTPDPRWERALHCLV